MHFGVNKSLSIVVVVAGSAGGGSSLKRPGSNQSDEAKRIKTYQCEACDKWFTSSGHLKRHFNTTWHKNATRHDHKSGGNPRIGTPIMGDLDDPNDLEVIEILSTDPSVSDLDESEEIFSKFPWHWMDTLDK